jgi:hypothetical protein
VAASGGMHGSTKCIAAGCNEEEKQEHLVRCPAIRSEFWDKVAALMVRLKMNAGSSDLKWLLGIKEDGIEVDKEEAAMIFWAWRNLYAEVTRARIEGKQLNLKTAYTKTLYGWPSREWWRMEPSGTDGTHGNTTRSKPNRSRSDSENVSG